MSGLNIKKEVLTDVTNPASITEQILIAVLKKAGLYLAGAQLDKLTKDMGLEASKVISQAKEALADFLK